MNILLSSFCFVSLIFETVSLCCLGWLGIHRANQLGPELPRTLPPLPPEYWSGPAYMSLISKLPPLKNPDPSGLR